MSNILTVEWSDSPTYYLFHEDAESVVSISVVDRYGKHVHFSVCQGYENPDIQSYKHLFDVYGNKLFVNDEFKIDKKNPHFLDFGPLGLDEKVMITVGYK